MQTIDAAGASSKIGPSVLNLDSSAVVITSSNGYSTTGRPTALPSTVLTIITLKAIPLTISDATYHVCNTSTGVPRPSDVSDATIVCNTHLLECLILLMYLTPLSCVIHIYWSASLLMYLMPLSCVIHIYWSALSF